MTPIVVSGPAELAEESARLIAEVIRSAVSDRGPCYLALAGGDTPRGAYERLSRPPYQAGLPWPAVHVFWSDERRVPLNDPQSNFALAWGALLSRVGVPGSQVHPMPVHETDGAVAAAAYARVLEAIPRNASPWPRFDLILLGLGEDGHTASLFPGDDALQERDALVRAVQAHKPPPERLTFTLPLINAARSVLFVVQGAGKKSALEGVLRRDPALPASLVRPVDGELRFIADRAAFPPG